MAEQAPVSDIMPFPASEETLANGLRVIIVPTGFPNLVSLQIPVQTGSRNEVEPGKSGFAHFFEHMMFRGTERYPAERYQAVLTRTGARQNAYTTDDYTNYHTTFAAEDLETILEIEADRFMNLRYSEEDFRTEARAILGEYNKSASEPLNKLIEVQRDHAYRVHPYKHTTMGFIADIEDMPSQYEYSRTFFERWYRPEYTTVVLAGDLDPANALEAVRRYWGPWQPGHAAEVEIPQEPAPGETVAAHVPWPTETLPWVTVGFHGPAFSESDPRYAALDVLFDLSFGETSELYQQLVEREQKADQLFPYFPANQDPGLATVFTRLKDPGDARHVRDAILRTLAEARLKPVTAERLAEAKANMRYGFARTLDNSESVAATLARFVRYRRSFDTLNQLFRTYDALTPQDLHRAAEEYLTDERMVITTLASGESLEGVEATPGLRAAEAEVAPASVERVARIELRSPSPLLRFKLLFTVGSAHDPAGKEGLAVLASEMIAEAGSERMRIDEINRALFPLAGGFDAQVDREMTVFTGVVHSDNAERFLDIVLPQLTDPGFREEDFARLKERQRNALVQDLRANNEEELGKERLQANIFAGSGYGHPSLGTVAGISSLTIEEVKRFVAERYCRANLTLGLAGDLPASYLARIDEALAKLPEGERSPEPPIAIHRPRGMEVEIVAKEARATAISFGHPIGVTRTHADFAALWLARSWLGEHRASHGRLFQRLREVRGLNYGNYAYIEAFPRGMYQFFPETNLGRRAQLFEVWVRPVVPEQAVFAFKAALWELGRLIGEGLTEEELEATRTYLEKSVFLLTKTQDQQLGYALDSAWYGMGDFVTEMRERLAALTVDGVNAAIRRHLSATDISAVFVAKDAERLRAALLSPEPATIEYGSARPDAVLAEDRLIGALPLGLTPERIRVTPVDQVFAE